ncbi:phosphate-starvation-inducible PsiE family protein [Sulfuriferula nivalis]|uniref:Uncharacterized protein n=1 Tax=Sulfuriferula nivalis TaxID=2675298 RepID=A0A809SDD7_9PROT|nr:phosphate-starvation-inducible PsiE family protein [Sulfuriferula nivalis]BBP00507.1 hypothetical protein SFSGTM_12150 [Sulfuriferula nivalis]
MFEKKLIQLLSQFNNLLHMALTVALAIASVMVIWQFSVDVFHAITHGYLIKGFLQSLGTLFLVWTLSSLISAEISFLQNGILHVRVFIEVVIITLLRQLLVAPVQMAGATPSTGDEFDPLHFGLILAALLVIGILHWLVGGASIAINRNLDKPT